MLKRILRLIRNLILGLTALGLAVLFVPRLITTIASWTHVYAVHDAPPERAAIVFGAGLDREGQATLILRDRIETGAQLYFSGKVQKLLMSGDNRFVTYNEPEAMRQYALSLGVPDSAIVLDYAGRNTYDTCYRAHAIFGLNSALLVTQRFHLPRALFLCNALGIQAAGVEATNYTYPLRWSVVWNTREQLATVAAFLDVYVFKPLPLLGDPEPMFSER
jgi:SanA protein